MNSQKRKRGDIADKTEQEKVRDEGFTVLADPDDADLEYVPCAVDIF